jgi:hypothetical protein
MPETNQPCTVVLPQALRVLTPQQVCQIDRCLAELEDFGQVTLIKRKGLLRFIEKTESVVANGTAGG